MLTTSKKPRRKLIYPVGLISLSILPLLFYNFLFQQYLQKDSIRVLEVNYVNPADTTFDINPLKRVNEKFPRIIFNGTDDHVKLEFARIAIRELVNQDDTTRGIEFDLTDNMKYSTFVALFNLCEVEGAHTYLHYQNKFWVFNIFPKSKGKIHM